jgi:acetolactate synthase-1/3 small subunit
VHPEARHGFAGARPSAGGLGAISGPPEVMNGSEPRKHTISVLVENKFGVLSRVAGLFSARGYNIESLSVGETLDPSVSRMTLVVSGDEFVIEQVMKQLHKLIDVIKVNDLTDESHVERELVLIRVNAEPQHRAEIMRTADIFRAKVVDVTPLSFVLEATGDEGKLEALLELLRPMGIQEIVRTGKVAISRGPKTRTRKTETPKPRPRVADDPRVVGFAD